MSDTLHHYYLQQLGIERWLIREKASVKPKLLIILHTIEDALVRDKGQALLGQMLKAVGLTNAVEIYPLEQSNLSEEIMHRSPKLILMMGLPAAQSLLKTTEPIQNLRSNKFSYLGSPVFVTHHPCSLLSKPPLKKQSYQDLLSANLWFLQ
ncbi:MAG: hypothetical protein NTW94_02665 [Legionellales bacterium]|nr:hypothetical protein [Legionellales bacterium]